MDAFDYLEKQIEVNGPMPYTHKGIEGHLLTHRRYGYLTVEHKANDKGREHPEYQKIKQELGDDFITDINIFEDMDFLKFVNDIAAQRSLKDIVAENIKTRPFEQERYKSNY